MVVLGAVVVGRGAGSTILCTPVSGAYGLVVTCVGFGTGGGGGLIGGKTGSTILCGPVSGMAGLVVTSCAGGAGGRRVVGGTNGAPKPVPEGPSSG